MRTKTDQALKARIEAEVTSIMASSVQKVGWKRDLVDRLSKDGAGSSTLYRWIENFIATGKPGQAAVRAVKKAAAKRVRREPDPDVSVGKAARKHLPAMVRLDEVTGVPTVRVIDELGIVVADLKALVKHAKGPDGGVRNARLLLSASDRVRACMETALKIQAAMRSVDEVDRLQAAMIAEIAKCDRDLAERVIRAMRAVSSTWSG
jgi:hypothetical protein